MSNVAASNLSNLMVARRLMELEKNAELRRNGKHVEDKSALEYWKEDQAFISDPAQVANQQNPAPQPPIENVSLKLPELQQAVAAGGNAPQADGAQQGFTVVSSASVEVKLEMRYKSNAPLEGLVVHDQNYAESDRYLFKFADGATFTILDKWSNKSTTVWGDPHVDVDDVAGENNGDFKDLKTSEDFTTFMLSDGTRLTFTAKDAGIIERVDIFKGNQHVTGMGQAAEGFSAENALFNPNVLEDGHSAASATKLGDVVYSGGDGNDWFDASNQLVWGKTTGSVITQRPPATLEFYYKQTMTQSISIQTLTRDA